MSSVYALLIGIDRYLRPVCEKDGYYPDLRGAVNDVEKVSAWLLEQGVPRENIKKLVAPRERRESKESSPTYENMVRAFADLKQSAQPGDHVWFHYSGHGGRVPSIYPGVKMSDTDEALVPTDIGDPRARYLRDIELAFLLEDLADAGLVVTAVLDCCHSGDAFRRGDPSPQTNRRGTDQVDETDRPKESLLISPGRLRSSWRDARRSVYRKVGKVGTWGFEPRRYVLFAACRVHEQALEENFEEEGGRGGVLTHWLLEALRSFPQEVSYRLLYDRIRAHMLERCSGQTPQLEGLGDRLVLKEEMSPSRGGIAILDIDAQSKRVLLNVGEAHGLSSGANLDVFSPDRHDVMAGLELLEIGAVFSRARLTYGDLNRIELGTPAFQEGTSPHSSSTTWLSRSDKGVSPALRFGRCRKVRVTLERSGSAENFERARQAIWNDGFLEILSEEESEEAADFEVVVDSEGYEIHDGMRRPIVGVLPIPFKKNGDERTMSWRLVHLARFLDVLEIDQEEEGSPLSTGLEIGLYRSVRPPGSYEVQKDLGEVNLEDLVLIPREERCSVGDEVYLRLSNISDKVLNVTILNLQLSNRCIEQIYPCYADFRPMEPGSSEILPFHLQPPKAAFGRSLSGVETYEDILKVFATLQASSFRCLELAPIDSSAWRSQPSLDFAYMKWTVCDLPISITRNPNRNSI